MPAQSGGAQSQHRIDLSLPDRFRFTFDRHDATWIYLLDHAQADTQRRVREGTLGWSELGRLVRSVRDTMILRLSGLLPGELLPLENWLQERIAARTGTNPHAR